MGKDHASLYDEVTARVIAQFEEGRLPWVQPWESGKAETGLPRNGATGRCYSGINVLILWATLFDKGFAKQRWLTFRQAQALGGNVRRGEQGTTVCYADRFTPKGEQEKARNEDREARQLAFLKRFTVFNVEQCEGLPDEPEGEATEPLGERELIPRAEALIAATGADFRIGGDLAFYTPSHDFIQVPHQQAYGEQINWYRTALHELGHWTGHQSRLGRFGKGDKQWEHYAREELVAEMCSAFTCAQLGIVPTVRHADYVGAWLDVLKDDSRAIFQAASKASNAADYLLAFAQDEEGQS